VAVLGKESEVREMPKVSLEHSNNSTIEIKKGDLFFIQNSDKSDFYFVAQAGPYDYRLVSLSSGNRWNDDNVYGKTVNQIVKLFKQNNYKATYYDGDATDIEIRA